MSELEEQIFTHCLNDYELKIARGNPESFDTKVAIDMAHERWRTQEFWWGIWKGTTLTDFKGVTLKDIEERKVELARRLATTTDIETSNVIRGKLAGLTDAQDIIKKMSEVSK